LGYEVLEGGVGVTGGALGGAVLGGAVLELVLQVGNRDVAVAHGAGDMVEGLVRHLRVIAPQGGGRAQHGDVGGGYRTEIKGCVIGGLVGQLTASSGGGEEDAGEDGEDGDQKYSRHIRIVSCPTSDVASAGRFGVG
jgi:hypothetical protein